MIQESKRLGANSAGERREPGAKSRRNLKIAVPAKGINHFINK